MNAAKAGFPMQPIYLDDVLRFKENEIVVWWVDNGNINMNKIVAEFFNSNPNDLQQFAQLIGYSVDGYFELGYVSNNTIKNIEGIIERDEYGMQNFKSPWQPLIMDDNGVVHFKSNEILDYFLIQNSTTLMDIMQKKDDFSSEDFEQLYMLIGYSVDGFVGQPKVTDEAIKKVDILVANQFPLK
ncbi:hypothetical protein GLP21_12610 [Photobacterium carnosum]|uniref:Uncharacterized protein n=1 Tax=Photobacterium carnosum TaxID=2023717 RepID=A0A2N4UWC0_9GAMM|nr:MULTISPECIES: hypothetical protein [Photobacterium]MCD9477232.1 hypothetical protein [Photobacterium phosphoreum]MCD9485957.1 hypothetical protein [Photobacterium iliopiscarium]MCD9508781.1 hypothetical protein [Photobacterium phosphoreum]MCD9539314.1 hypothetical protein [Photobacterium carnosum]MCD9543033.1 hypothetical protein [Photobacterium carnosum]